MFVVAALLKKELVQYYQYYLLRAGFYLAAGPDIHPISMLGWFLTASNPMTSRSQSDAFALNVLSSSPVCKNISPGLVRSQKGFSNSRKILLTVPILRVLMVSTLDAGRLGTKRLDW